MSSTFGQPKPTVKAPTKPAGFLFEFKDGTRFRGKVFSGDPLGRLLGANKNGLILEAMDGRIYIHHYPPVNRRPARAYNSFAGYTPNGDGTYSPVDQAIPEPPTDRIEINPTRGIDFNSVGWRFGYGLIHRTVSAVAVGCVSRKAVVGSRGASVHRRIVVDVNASIHRLKDESVFVGAKEPAKGITAKYFAAESCSVLKLKQEPRRFGGRFDGWFWLPEC